VICTVPSHRAAPSSSGGSRRQLLSRLTRQRTNAGAEVWLKPEGKAALRSKNRSTAQRAQQAGQLSTRGTTAYRPGATAALVLGGASGLPRRRRLCPSCLLKNSAAAGPPSSPQSARSAQKQSLSSRSGHLNLSRQSNRRLMSLSKQERPLTRARRLTLCRWPAHGSSNGRRTMRFDSLPMHTPNCSISVPLQCLVFHGEQFSLS
jgi:hypothetical protein